MNNRFQREKDRIRAGYYQIHNYTWQYVLEPGEDQNLLTRVANGKIRRIESFRPENNWTDFVRYKFGPDGGDCDSSAAAMLTFEMAYSYLKDGVIEARCEKMYEYKINKDNKIYGGDTMTSALTPFKLYLAFLRKASKEEDEFSKWVSLIGKDRVCIPSDKDYVYYKQFNDYLKIKINDLDAPIGKKLSQNCKLFLENVWNQGNMIPVPEFFNKARASNKYGDTVDRMLTYLYYFIISEEDIYLERLFCVKENVKTAKEEAKEVIPEVENTKEWISKVVGNKEGKEAWNDFVTNNFLQPFCKLDENEVYIPICMFNGKTLSDNLQNPYNKEQLRFLPETLEECECFFRTCNKAIIERSKLIQEKINKLE